MGQQHKRGRFFETPIRLWMVKAAFRKRDEYAERGDIKMAVEWDQKAKAWAKQLQEQENE